MRLLSTRSCLTILIVGSQLVAGCAHVPGGKPRERAKALLAKACEPGSRVRSVRGSIWLKAKSAEASGQFPAYVEAESPGSLELQITNLLGGTEAVIQIRDGSYKISSPSRKVREERGYGAWGGIPLHWATDLFLGRVPCPSGAELATARVSSSETDELVIETEASLESEAERYVFGFRTWAGQPWPERLRWERSGPMSVAVDFKFDDPEDRTHSPRKWEAKSSSGEVKVRWKEREVSS